MSVKGVIGVRGMAPSGNGLTQPPGTLLEAQNCVIPSKESLGPRRGQKLSTYIDNSPGDANAARALELAQWDAHLLVHYASNAGNKLALWQNWATSPSYLNVGSFDAPDSSNLRMKFAELTKSLYFTTSNGLYTLDAPASSARAAGVSKPSDFFISEADGGLATRLTGNPNAAGSWLAKDKAVAYRAVLGLKDANGVVKLGASNGRLVVVNPADLVIAIGGVVRAANVVTVTLGAGQTHGYRIGDILNLTVTGGDVGNFTTTNRTITNVTSTTFTYAETAANYTNVAAVTFTSGTKSVRLMLTFGTEVQAGWFLQLYRTDESATAAIDPGDEVYLAYERIITAADISTGYLGARSVAIDDTTPSAFLGAPLSSNKNSGKGLLGVAERPPKMNDVCVWDGKLWGVECVDRHRLPIRLLGCDTNAGGLRGGDVLAVNARAYVFGGGSYVSPYSIEVFGWDLPSKNIERTCRSMALVLSQNVADAGATLLYDGDSPTGQVLLEQRLLGSTFADGASGAINAIYAATTRKTAWADQLADLKSVTAASTARTGGNTVTVRCTGHDFVAGQRIMVAYQATGTPDANFAPGLKTVATVVDANNFTYTESGSNVTLSGATAYYVYATTFVSSQQTDTVRFSEPGLPESWPLANTLGGLPDRAKAYRVRPLAGGDGLVIALKDGGFYVVSGQYPYVVRRLDGTADLVAPDTLVEHAGQLHALTSQGVCSISEAGVGILSTDVDKLVRLLIARIRDGSTAPGLPFGVSYESEQQCLLFVPQETGAGTGAVTATVQQALVFKSLSGDFTRWTPMTRTCGLVWKGGDYLLLGDVSTNRLRQERKTLTWLDYADEDLTFTVDGAYPSGVTTVHVYESSASGVQVGDVVWNWDGTYALVTAVGSFSGGANNYFVVDRPLNTFDTSALVVYRQYPISFTWAVDSRGTPGVESRWKQLQLHFAERLFDALTVTYKGEKSNNTGSVVVHGQASGTLPALDTPVRRLSTLRAKVADDFERVAMQQITVSFAQALVSFELLGYSGTGEPITERTGQ